MEHEKLLYTVGLTTRPWKRKRPVCSSLIKKMNGRSKCADIGGAGIIRVIIIKPVAAAASLPSSFTCNTGIQGYKDTRIQGYRDTRIQGFRDSGIQKYRDTGIQGYRDTGKQGNRNTGIQGYRDIGIQGYRVTRIQRIQ